MTSDCGESKQSEVISFFMHIAFSFAKWYTVTKVVRDLEIVILALNSKYIHSSLAPWYLKAEVPVAEVVEHTINEDILSVVADIVKKRPRLLAISVYIWNVTFAEKVAALVKDELPDIIVAVGGPEVSYNPKEVLGRCTAIDYVISGEGEVPFSALCRKVLYGEDCFLPGISYGSYVAEPYIGTGTPKSPYTDAYFSALQGRIAYFESSRGCPYSCAYCLSGRCEGIRFFDMDYVRENLLRVANSGTKTVKFVDRTFNADRKRAIEILSFIKAGSGVSFPSDVCFHFELSGDLLDDATIAFLKTVPHGLFQFEIGIQSFFPKTIQAIHRKTESSILKRRIQELVRLGNAHVHTDLIAGLPYEGYDDFKDSFDQAYFLGANMLQLGFLKILHGTEIENRAKEYGFRYTKQPPYEVFETPWLSQAEVVKLKITENAVDRLHNSGRFRRVIELCLPLFDRPYDFFYTCGRLIAKEKNLDTMTDALFLNLSKTFPDRTDEIRDAFVCDRLATNSARGFPKALYHKDPRISLVKKQLNADMATAEKAGVRRSVSILYHKQVAVYVDYERKDWRGEYPLNFVKL